MKDFRCHGDGERREGGRGGRRENSDGYIFQTSNRKGLFPLLLQYIIPEAWPALVIGSAFASGSVLELAVSAGLEESFYQLVVEATPCWLPTAKTLPAKPIACADQTLQLWLAMVQQEGRKCRKNNVDRGCGDNHQALWHWMGGCTNEYTRG